MINTQDQEELFKLIAEYLEKDLECVAVGGTALMFSGYKTATKDIDLVFKNRSDMEAFIRAIEKLGYKEKALAGVYDDKRKACKGKPRMYTRGEERFDLFAGNIFGFKVSFEQEDAAERIDFKGKKELTLLIPPKETLLLLKAITGRERDYEDIETILEIENNINWEGLISKAVEQKKNNEWILIDLEQAMQRLRKKFFIKKKFFDMIYEAQERNSIA
ncbi:hypothetical protein D6745_04855 [Candidatus Woesearchaeota archaeon]|nr:MAG: hypothetical protein D6745_04855 [Candidatus Woesearchaeota archaeon]